MRIVGIFLALALPLCAAEPRTPDAIAREIIAPMLDQKARLAGGDVSAVIDAAQVQAKCAKTSMWPPLPCGSRSRTFRIWRWKKTDLLE